MNKKGTILVTIIILLFLGWLAFVVIFAKPAQAPDQVVEEKQEEQIPSKQAPDGTIMKGPTSEPHLDNPPQAMVGEDDDPLSTSSGPTTPPPGGGY